MATLGGGRGRGRSKSRGAKWGPRRGKKRRIKIVGGGFRVTAEGTNSGGSMKAQRRAQRRLIRAMKKR